MGPWRWTTWPASRVPMRGRVAAAALGGTCAPLRGVGPGRACTPCCTARLAHACARTDETPLHRDEMAVAVVGVQYRRIGVGQGSRSPEFRRFPACAHLRRGGPSPSRRIRARRRLSVRDRWRTGRFRRAAEADSELHDSRRALYRPAGATLTRRPPFERIV